ncbi:50S ribosomal protein L11 methyltransferase [Metallumcola ferriviriculae]|uniref:Ribosomal protein L11 methyltransferase n=1 Tax=Metallumcola ferriviriculae TaxID=3039180 RepID=A0AAU0UQ07_9FIRM|nr:50S ribosomal protein L11 methyltransferase [Desulfitibacteraceae bacterium MK1]
MEWQEISITTTEDAMESVTDLFYQAGAAGVVIEDPRVVNSYLKEKKWDYYELPLAMVEAESVVVKGYLLKDDRLPQSLLRIRQGLDNLAEYFDDYRAEIALTEVKESDWANAWKRFYKPVKVSERIVIKPTWEQYQLEGNEKVIELDPGMAFGTGTHPTTVMSIRALEQYLPTGARVIDVGAGSGVLAIAAAKLGAEQVLAIDIDPLALKVAAANVEINAVSSRVQVRPGNLLVDVESQADLVVANIIADVIMDLAGQVWQRLESEGLFIASGIIDDRGDEVVEYLQAKGFIIETVLHQEGWVALVVRKAD